MSSSRSFDSTGDKTSVTGSGTGTGAPDFSTSPLPTPQQYHPKTPQSPSHNSTSIAPQNPFDTITDVPPIPALKPRSGPVVTTFQQDVTSNIIAANASAGIEQSKISLLSNSSDLNNSPERTSLIALQSPAVPISPRFETFDCVPSETSSSSIQLLPIVFPQRSTSQELQQTFEQSDRIFPCSPMVDTERNQVTASVPLSFSDQQEYPHNGDDDDKTEPSSAANTAEHGNLSDNQGIRRERQQITNEKISGPLLRLYQETKRIIAPKENRKDSDGDDLHDGALISGFLQKYGRNGKWQTRWFESDGECLSYYKNGNRTKLLATLDLEKVGGIEIDPEDSKQRSFTIQVLGRMYHLRADSRTSCIDWVITLNRIKEARLQQGNVKLVSRPLDFLDSNVDDLTPRVVVVANRERTRAVDEEAQWGQLYQIPSDKQNSTQIEQKRLSSLSTAVLGRWSKRRTSLQRLGTKLSQWARSVKKYGCLDIDAENVALDRHVHPPGHDDGKQQQGKVGSKTIDKWTLNVSPNAPVDANPTPDPILPRIEPCKPFRSLSTSSEDIRTIS